MSNEIKNSIEELKKVVLDLHRSAGQLDEVIRKIESEINSVSTEEYLKNFIKANGDYRGDVKKCYRYDNLEHKEKLIWQKLIKSLKIES